MDTIKNIKLIIKLCREKNTFLVYFTNNFWKYILNYFKEANQDNIEICFEIRETFLKYHELILEVFKKKDAKFTIKKEAINYYEIDEFAFVLDQLIKKYINSKSLGSIEKLAHIVKFNPYYKESKYSMKVDCGIFDYFNLNEIDNNFIDDFKGMNFEYIYK